MKTVFSLTAMVVFAASLIAFARAQDSEEIPDFGDVDALGKSTKAGQMLEDRLMARTLLDYGSRAKSPESILTAIQILHRNPVNPVKKGNQAKSQDSDDTEALLELVDRAKNMRRGDKTLAAFADRVADELEEGSRGLAGGPKRWAANIPKGGSFLLDPRLVYNRNEKAMVTVHAPDSVLGISVIRGDQRRETVRSVGRASARVIWNSGIYTTGWNVKIYKLSGPDNTPVIIETN